MHLGIALPFGDIGGDGPIVREYAELAEADGVGDLDPRQRHGAEADAEPAAEGTAGAQVLRRLASVKLGV